MTTKPADYDALENRLREDCYCSDVGMVEMCKPCQAADAIRDLRAERDALRTRKREIYEVYAGSEGFIPETAPEAYQQWLIKQIVALAAQEP